MDYLSLCLICKDENDYLPEWLDYHILIGVERFYIYDNESQVSLRESLADYIERGWVVVIDIPGRAMQLYAYDHCLQTFGTHTRWLGFIDTDEFLVPKATLDLKELLRDYEAYGGLAVSSFFFGSNGYKKRPAEGQIAAYTRRTHETFSENELVKSIVQPAFTVMPNSPHDFIYRENYYCVNESFLRVEGQRFPNHTVKIQLDHFYCRSLSELGQKLIRGGGVRIDPWPRKRFEIVNQFSTYQDTILQNNLVNIFREGRSRPEIQEIFGLREKMAVAVHDYCPRFLELIPVEKANRFRDEFSLMEELKAKTRQAVAGKDYDEIVRITILRLQMAPQSILIGVELSLIYIENNDLALAWETLGHFWQISPNNYLILITMAYYFLKSENYVMAENSCRLVLGQAPHNLVVLGMLTHSLVGQERYEDALKVGVPVVELSAQLGELPKGMSGFLIKKMADYLLDKLDYDGAASLWEIGVLCQPGDVNAILELTHALMLKGDKVRARQRLAQAHTLEPQNEAVLAMIKQVGLPEVARKKRR